MSDVVTSDINAALSDAEVEAAEAANTIPVEVDTLNQVPTGTSNEGNVVMTAGDEGEFPKQLADLQQKLSQIEKEKRDNWDKYLRASADVENVRKRARRDVDDAKFETKSKVLKEMLPVLDNLERAIEHAAAGQPADDGESEEAKRHKGMIDGLRLVLRQFATAFERLDVTPIAAEGQPFDPNLHEAISQTESSEVAPGGIVAVVQKGYRTGDKLLRPALVVVAKAKTE